MERHELPHGVARILRRDADITGARVSRSGAGARPRRHPHLHRDGRADERQVASDGGGYLVVWADGRSSTADVFGARVTEAAPSSIRRASPSRPRPATSSRPPWPGTAPLPGRVERPRYLGYRHLRRGRRRGAVLDPAGIPISPPPARSYTDGGLERRELSRRVGRLSSHGAEPRRLRHSGGRHRHRAGSGRDRHLDRPTSGVQPVGDWGGRASWSVARRRRPRSSRRSPSSRPVSARRAAWSIRPRSACPPRPPSSSRPTSPGTARTSSGGLDRASRRDARRVRRGAQRGRGWPSTARASRSRWVPRCREARPSRGAGRSSSWPGPRTADIYGARVTPGGSVRRPGRRPDRHHAGQHRGEPRRRLERHRLRGGVGSRPRFRPDVVGDIYGARVTGAGTVRDPGGFVVSDAAGQQNGPAVASNGTTSLVVWHNGGLLAPRHHRGGVSAGGTVLDPSGITVSSANQPFSPDVTGNGPRFLVVWNDVGRQRRHPRGAGDECRVGRRPCGNRHLHGRRRPDLSGGCVERQIPRRVARRALRPRGVRCEDQGRGRAGSGRVQGLGCERARSSHSQPGRPRTHSGSSTPVSRPKAPYGSTCAPSCAPCPPSSQAASSQLTERRSPRAPNPNGLGAPGLANVMVAAATMTQLCSIREVGSAVREPVLDGAAVAESVVDLAHFGFPSCPLDLLGLGLEVSLRLGVWRALGSGLDGRRPGSLHGVLRAGTLRPNCPPTSTTRSQLVVVIVGTAGVVVIAVLVVIRPSCSPSSSSSS